MSYEDSRVNESLSFVAGAVLGVAAGAVVGLLFAPKSGAQTRRDIKRQGQALRDQVEDKIRDIDIKPMIADAKKTINKHVDTIKSEIDKSVKSAQKKLKK